MIWIKNKIKEIREWTQFVEKHSNKTDLNAKIYIQILVSLSFLILSVANICSKSYLMLGFTLAGSIINGVLALLAKKVKNSRICSITTIATCSVLFGLFVVNGGNEGFACLWVMLVPFFAMMIMDFAIGFYVSAAFQVFLIVVFWTPMHEMLGTIPQYYDQFCLRFPLFFFVTFILAFSLTVSLKKSQYNDCKQRLKLEEMAQLDSLTKLSNRRNAYEKFKTDYSEPGIPHCIVMCDIDHFKRVNDTYGHVYGDDVLVAVVELMKEQLPPDYLKSRWGGEEFLLAANESLNAVYHAVERLRIAISDHVFYAGDTQIHITLTFGIAEYVNENGIVEAISKADDRLYSGKKAKRNCTVIDDSLS